MNEIVPSDMEFDMLQVIGSLQQLDESPSSSALPDVAIVEKQLHSILGVLQSQAATAAATEENEGALACLLPHSLDIILSCRKLRAQGQVDSAKVLTIAGNSWLHRSGKFELDISIHQPKLMRIAQTLIELALSAEIVHDGFQIAFHTLLLVQNQTLTEGDNGERLGSLISLLTQSLNDLTIKRAIDAQRCELLVGFFTSTFEICHRQVALQSFASVSVDALVKFQAKMKAAVGNTTPNERASMRIACSEARKGSISALVVILDVCPSWIQENKKFYWEMIIKLVGSPLLLPVGYRALCDDREMISSIVKCILTQLSCIDRYSLAVASDVVIAVRELATAGCVELFLNSSSSSSCLELVLEAFVSKIPKDVSTAKQGEDEEDLNPRCQWRCLLAQIFTDIFRSVLKANEIRPTGAFIDSFCTSIITYILSLYSALGLKSFSNKLYDEVASICGDEDPTTVTLCLHEFTSLFLVFLESVVISLSTELQEASLCKLMQHLLEIGDRVAVFEDDDVQINMELELLVRCTECLIRNKSLCLDSRSLVVLSIKKLLHITLSDSGSKVEIAKEGLLGLVDAADESSRGVVEKLLLEGDYEGTDAANEEVRADRLIAILLP